MDKLELIEKIMRSRNRSYRNYSRHTAHPVPYSEGVVLTLAELEILRVIGEQESISPMELVYIMGRTKGAISQVLNKLQAKALISERADAQDQRKKQLSLTPLGEMVYGEDRQRVQRLYQYIEELLDGVDARSLEDYLTINERMRKGIMNYYELENI